MRLPLQQWHAKVRVDGVHASYTIRLRLPHLDDEDHDDLDEPGAARPAPVSAERVVTSTRLRAPLNDDDRMVLAARFEEYLTWRHSGAAQPRSAREAADRIGWQAHTVTKRCENIRSRYVRIGVPGLRGPRALEELAALLISTGELTPEDLGACPPAPRPADRARWKERIRSGAAAKVRWPYPVTEEQWERVTQARRSVIARRQEICIETKVGLTTLYNAEGDPGGRGLPAGGVPDTPHNQEVWERMRSRSCRPARSWTSPPTGRRCRKLNEALSGGRMLAAGWLRVQVGQPGVPLLRRLGPRAGRGSGGRHVGLLLV